MDQNKVRDMARNIFNTNPFDSHGYSPVAVAQDNLRGKTHYVDSDTLRWHKSRINACFAFNHGAFFALIESCALDMHNTKRGFRFVVFDLAGNVIERAKLDETYKTSEKARAAMWAFSDTLDAKKYYRELIKEKIARDAKKLKELRAFRVN